MVERLRLSPGLTGIFSDFDGTLSDIVSDPETAVPVAGVVDALGALATCVGRVAIVSGRPVDFLVRQHFSPAVALIGVYGLESVVDGVRSEHVLGREWAEVVNDVAAQSEAEGPHGMRVESKGFSMTLHFREHPEIEAEVQEWAALQATGSGLVVRPARMSFELHPPITVDKGSALVAIAQGLTAACFLGDDVGDLPAFDGLDELARDGVATMRIAVRTSESSRALLDRADLVVDGPAGALNLLRQFSAAASA